MKKLAAVLLAGIVVFGLTACPRHSVLHHKPKGGPPPHAKAHGLKKHHHGSAVAIKKGHGHSAHCGHYKHKGKWFHHGGHAHKHGCGHVLSGGIWIFVD